MAVRSRRYLLLLLLLFRRKRRRNIRRRSVWVREIFVERTSLGEYHRLIQEMRLVDNESFYKYFHMTPGMFDDLLSRVGPVITRKTTNLRHPISAGERLAVTLRYIVTGDTMQTISFSYRLGHATVSCIIEDTCQAIWSVLSPEFLRPPNSPDEWRQVSEKFNSMWNFPHCVGAIDGKHVALQAPPNSGSQYYNYKGYHSIVLMAVCDAEYCFLLVDIGDYGRQSDSGIFSNSLLGHCMKNDLLSLPGPDLISGLSQPMPYFFVGDSAFPLNTFMLKPYPGTYLDQQKRIFNYRLSRARRVIENAFGILSSKFRIFRRPIIAKPEKATKITQAACVLHNYLRISEMSCPASSRVYCPIGLTDREDRNGNVIPGDWRTQAGSHLCSIGHTGSNMYSRTAAHMRDDIMKYFNSQKGAVSWQRDHVNAT